MATKSDAVLRSQMGSATDVFGIEAISIDLMGQTARGMSFTVAAQICKFVLQLASVAILARLLEPSDFGLVTMVMVLTGLVQVVADGGLSAATIQYPAITHAQVTSLFWINAALGAGLAGSLVLASPLIAWLYHDPRLTGICVASSVSFLIGGFTVQSEALLRRRMCFRDLAFIDVTATGIGIGAASVAALASLGYWALILMPLVNGAARLLMVWVASPWRPGRLRSAPGLRGLLKFGAHVAGINIIGVLAANTTPFAIGLIGGPHVLGLYNRANTLSSLPSAQLMPAFISVAQPALARVAGEPERFRRAALSLVNKITLLSSFITITLISTADFIVHIFLGPEWTGAIPLFRILALFALVEPLAAALAASITAAGRADVLLVSKFVTLAAVVSAALIGTIWGVFGIVAMVAISGLFVRLPVFLWFSSKALPLTQRDFYGCIAIPLAISLLTLAALTSVRFWLGEIDPLIGLCMCLSAAVFCHALLCLCFRSTRATLKEIGELLQKSVALQNACEVN